MKKILLVASLALVFLIVTPAAHAATAQAGGTCTLSPDNCPTSYACNASDMKCHPTCTANPSICTTQYGPTYACQSDGKCRPATTVTADGTVVPGGVCTTDSNCEDTTDWYGCYPEGNGTCTLHGLPPAAAASTTPAAAPSGGSGNFIPLTNLPIFANGNITTAPTLPAFFNALYIYCVGIAAVLTVLQIIRSGIEFMGGDSITETRAAKDRIRNSLLGLLLVLSPVIVFSIINPNILNLNIGNDFSSLTPASSAPAATATPTPTTTNPTSLPIQPAAPPTTGN